MLLGCVVVCTCVGSILVVCLFVSCLLVVVFALLILRVVDLLVVMFGLLCLYLRMAGYCLLLFVVLLLCGGCLFWLISCVFSYCYLYGCAAGCGVVCVICFCVLVVDSFEFGLLKVLYLLCLHGFGLIAVCGFWVCCFVYTLVFCLLDLVCCGLYLVGFVVLNVVGLDCIVDFGCCVLIVE